MRTDLASDEIAEFALVDHAQLSAAVDSCLDYISVILLELAACCNTGLLFFQIVFSFQATGVPSIVVDVCANQLSGVE